MEMEEGYRQVGDKEEIEDGDEWKAEGRDVWCITADGYCGITPSDTHLTYRRKISNV